MTSPIFEYVELHCAGGAPLLISWDCAGTDSRPLVEAKRIAIGKGYELLKHQPHTSPGLEHIHVYRHGTQICAVSVDGGAHDDSAGRFLPNHVVYAVQRLYPRFKIPPGHLLETFSDALGGGLKYDNAAQGRLLTEST